MKTTILNHNIRKASHPRSWLGLATILALFTFLRSADNASATIYTLSVPDTVPWTDTGIFISGGSQLEISASGTATYGFSPGQSCDPNGGNAGGGPLFYANGVLPNVITHSLIGKTGGTSAVGDGTPVPQATPGFVGTSYNGTISTGGELYLGFNDATDGFWDNSGSFSVTVDVVPVPEPSMAAFGGLAFVTVLAGRMRRKRSDVI